MIGKYKKILLFIFLILLPINVFGDSIELYSNNVLVYNLDTKEILYSVNSDKKISIASLTKIMTVIVSLENIKDIDEVVSFPRISSLNDYSKIGFNYGEKVTYRDLLYSAILPSAADATEALAILISGSTGNFVELMNSKAKELKMNSTSFSNTYGKDSDSNYSTLEDLLKLMLYALNNKEFYNIFTSKKYKLTNGKEISSSLDYYTKGTNIDTSMIMGAKTGFTNSAGYCMMSIYKEGDTNLLIISTSANYKLDKPTQILDSLKIGEYYNKNYKYINVLDENEYIGSVIILNFNEKIYSDEEIKLYLRNDTKVAKRYKAVDVVDFKTKVGDKVGEYIISYDDKKLVKDVIIPNTFKFKFLLFLNKYISVIKWLTRFLIFT